MYEYKRLPDPGSEPNPIMVGITLFVCVQIVLALVVLAGWLS